MAMVLLRELEDRFQADVWCEALEAEGIPHLLRTYQDTAYDGLFVSQRGYASLYVEEEWLPRARRVDDGLAGRAPEGVNGAADLARRIDHTLLDPNAGEAELLTHLEQCREMGAAAACLNPWLVARAARELAGSPVKVCAVVGFPLGTNTATAKLAEAQELAQLGAQEIDVVLNRGLALSGREAEAVAEIAAIARALPGRAVKVILEVSALGPELTQRVCARLLDSGAAFVKTGSGYFGGATVGEVQMLRAAVGQRLGVKAAGGIRDLEQALALVGAGADRLGASAGYAIWREAKRRWPDRDS
ncbi:MAG: deoxyribose-phosphate aldolase [Desulfarculus sp.]|nr:deoxyribose-phosphate aldolase [Desulfarculus sp.]